MKRQPQGALYCMASYSARDPLLDVSVFFSLPVLLIFFSFIFWRRYLVSLLFLCVRLFSWNLSMFLLEEALARKRQSAFSILSGENYINRTTLFWKTLSCGADIKGKRKRAKWVSRLVSWHVQRYRHTSKKRMTNRVRSAWRPFLTFFFWSATKSCDLFLSCDPPVGTACSICDPCLRLSYYYFLVERCPQLRRQMQQCICGCCDLFLFVCSIFFLSMYFWSLLTSFLRMLNCSHKDCAPRLGERKNVSHAFWYFLVIVVISNASVSTPS